MDRRELLGTGLRLAVIAPLLPLAAGCDDSGDGSGRDAGAGTGGSDAMAGGDAGAPTADGGSSGTNGGTGGGSSNGGTGVDAGGTTGVPDASVSPEAGLDAAVDCSSVSAKVENNFHGHRLSVPSEDLSAPEETVYTTSEDAGHTHTVTLTTAHFEALLAGGTVEVESTNVNGHSHAVTVECG